MEKQELQNYISAAGKQLHENNQPYADGSWSPQGAWVDVQRYFAQKQLDEIIAEENKTITVFKRGESKIA